jgi:hypothetical protein
VSRCRLPLYLLQCILISGGDQSVFRRWCDCVSDWDELFDHAEFHGVAGLLHTFLKVWGVQLPGEKGRELIRRAAAGRLLLRHQHQGMCSVLEAFRKAGLVPVVLKGPILGERLYGDPLIRFWSDVDVLIAPADIEPVSGLLQSMGYRQLAGPIGQYERAHSHHLTFHHDKLPMLEAHFRLMVDFGATIPAESFLERAIAYKTRDGMMCRVLAPEDELFFLCLHAAHHQFVRFAWLYDIWTFLRAHERLDWAFVFGRAERLDAGEAILYSAELLHRRLGVAIPMPARTPGRVLRHDIATSILRVYNECAALDSASTLLSLCFRASLCDRLSSTFSFLGHYLGRLTRHQFQRHVPWLVPEEWSA